MFDKSLTLLFGWTPVHLIVFDQIQFKLGLAYVRRLGTKQKHGNELDDKKDLEQMKEPQPAKIRKDHTADDGSQAGSRVQDEVDEGDAQTALVDKIDVSHRGYDQTLKGARGETLNDPGGKQVVIADASFTDRRSNDIQES